MHIHPVKSMAKVEDTHGKVLVEDSETKKKTLVHFVSLTQS